MHVADLGLELLHPNTIWRLTLGPGDEAACRPPNDAVEVDRDESNPKAEPFCEMLTAISARQTRRRSSSILRCARGVLRFGSFKTRPAAQPVFLQCGASTTGQLGVWRVYASRLDADGVAFDGIFGPAYKGTTLARRWPWRRPMAGAGRSLNNRKEAKDHGEGGQLVGAALAGRVLIVDDVSSADTSVRESMALSRPPAPKPVRWRSLWTAGARHRRRRQRPCHQRACSTCASTGLAGVAIATMADLLGWLQRNADRRWLRMRSRCRPIATVMASEARSLRGALALAVAAAAACLLGAAVARAQPPAASAGIYTCIDDRGRRLTADRPIAECTAREQHILNSDGSLRRVVPPTLTAEERAAHEPASARRRKRARQAVRGSARPQPGGALPPTRSATRGARRRSTPCGWR